MLISIILNVLLLLMILAMFARFRASPIYFTFKNISGSLRRIYDNIRRGWNQSELWCLSTIICLFVLPRLKELRQNVQGHPADFSKECYGEVYDDDCNDDFENGLEEWKKVLDKMIFSFECIASDNDDIDYPPINYKTEQREGGFYFVMDGTPEEIQQHDKDFAIFKEKRDARQIIVNEGLQLFAKYFENLWD